MARLFVLLFLSTTVKHGRCDDASFDDKVGAKVLAACGSIRERARTRIVLLSLARRASTSISPHQMTNLDGDRVRVSHSAFVAEEDGSSMAARGSTDAKVRLLHG